MSKSHPRVEACGEVDELNAYIGLLSDQELNLRHSSRLERLEEIQNHLFDIGSYLATPAREEKVLLPDWPEDASLHLEEDIDLMESTLEPMTHFILPGGHPSVSLCHVARCVCRRAERRIVQLQETGTFIDASILPYINRLSDYLFVLTRCMSQELGVSERRWIPYKKPQNRAPRATD